MSKPTEKTDVITATPSVSAEPAGDSTARGSRLRQHAAHVGFLVLVITALFWRVLILGETFVDARTLDNQLPWGYYAAASSDHPYNRRDLTDTYITRDYFVVEAFKDGEMPLWNPYTMAGHPIYADGVTRTLSPSLLFYTFLDVPLGYSVARVFELMLAAVFMYAFLVSIRISPRGALMGSLVFALSAHSLFHVTGLGWWGGLMWLPLILLFVDRAISRSSFKSAIIAGVFLAAQFFCGWMQNQIYYVGAVILYYIFFAFQQKRRARPLLSRMAVTLATGFALAATQWLPVMELLSYSNRKIVPTEIGYIYLPPWYAATLIFPDIFGAAHDTTTLNLFTALNVSHDHILYLGITALMPLAFYVYNKGEKGRARFFFWLALLAVVVMMAAPLYVHVTKFIPVLQVIRVTVRVWVLFIFAAAALVGFGTDMLLRSDGQALSRFARVWKRLVISAFALAVIGTVVALITQATGFAENSVESGPIAFARKSAAALAPQFLPPGPGIVLPLLFLSALLFLIKRRAADRLNSRAFFAALLALLVIDLAWVSFAYNPTFDRSRVFPATATTELLRSLEPGRVLVVPADLETNRRVDGATEKIVAPPNTLLPYEISTVTGKNQQFPRWYREYASLVEPQRNLSHVVFDKSSSRYFDLLNVRYVMTRQSEEPLPGLELINTAEGVSIYENKNALPRAFVVGRAVEASSRDDALAALSDPSFDPKTAVVIQSQISNLKSEISNPGSARIIEDRRNRVVIETQSGGDGYLVLSDNYYPGWRASVDGVETEVLRANHTMRAVRLPAGSHVVSFDFDPLTLRISLYVSLIAAAVVAFSLLLLRKR
ncbi:MAG TPA: YfhO family protein [Blastocatellia bacterium]|nr:YfhO family protein [Blastocatellia bacterium]